MRFDVISLFPDIFAAVCDHGVTGRAYIQGRWVLQTWNPRDTINDTHRRVDDRPYGGGPGMVMLAGPLRASVERALSARAQLTEPSQANLAARPSKDISSRAIAPVILLSPTGRRFNQAAAQYMADRGGAVLICGRYKGVDQRFIDAYVDEEWSIGDFVLSGGEIAALAVIDSAVRLLPGVLSDGDSARFDSFHDAMSGLLDSPNFTRPEVFNGMTVPNVLLSGHHVKISAWRREQSLRLTATRRPDLIAMARAAGRLSDADEHVLAIFKQSLSD